MTERRIDRVLAGDARRSRARGQNQIAHRIEKGRRRGARGCRPFCRIAEAKGPFVWTGSSRIDHEHAAGGGAARVWRPHWWSTGGVYAGKVVDDTGAGGFPSVRNWRGKLLAPMAPAQKLVLFELRRKLALYQVERELAELDAATRFEIVAVLGSVTSEEKKRNAVRPPRSATTASRSILHAAAYKHCAAGPRTNPLEGAAQQTFRAPRSWPMSPGTKAVTDFSGWCRPTRRVNPRNVMGGGRNGWPNLVVLDLAGAPATRPGSPS